MHSPISPFIGFGYFTDLPLFLSRYKKSEYNQYSDTAPRRENEAAVCLVLTSCRQRAEGGLDLRELKLEPLLLEDLRNDAHACEKPFFGEVS